MVETRPIDGNLFDGLAAQSDEEQFTDLLNTPGLKIERIVSMGQVTEPGTWLDQAWTEWVLVISGAAAILFEEEAEPHQLKAGDYLMIEPHCRHRVTWTKENEPTIWLAVHFGDLPETDGAG